MQKMSDSVKKMTIFVVGIVLSTLIAIHAETTSYHNFQHMNTWHRELGAMGYLATPLWMIGFIIYVAAFDSRKRWPHLKGFFNRAGAMFTFDAHHEDEQAKAFRNQYPNGD